MSMLRRIVFFLPLFFLALLSAAADLHAQSFAMDGTLVKGAGYSVYLVERSGKSTAAAVSANGKFSFKKVTRTQLKGATLQISDASGRYAGPVVLGGSGTKVSTTFSGKPLSSKSKKMALGKIALQSGYAQLGKSATKVLGGAISKATTKAVAGKPLGAGQLGLVSTGGTANAKSSLEGMAVDAGSDDDGDGIPSAFDADDDGDLILDPSDPDSAGGDIPYTSIVLDFRNSLMQRSMRLSAARTYLGWLPLYRCPRSRAGKQLVDTSYVTMPSCIADPTHRQRSLVVYRRALQVLGGLGRSYSLRQDFPVWRRLTASAQ